MAMKKTNSEIIARRALHNEAHETDRQYAVDYIQDHNVVGHYKKC